MDKTQTEVVHIGGQRVGKTLMIQKMMREYTRSNPTAIIAEVGMINGQRHVRIEKPITDADLVPELGGAA